MQGKVMKKEYNSFDKSSLDICPRCGHKLRDGFISVADYQPRWFCEKPRDSTLFLSWLPGSMLFREKVGRPYAKQAKFCDNCLLFVTIVEVPQP